MTGRIAAALLLLATAPLRAGDPPKLKGEIVVTPERGAAERDAVAASVTVITREQLDKLPAQSLAEVVNAVPGITMDFDAEPAGAPMITSRGFFGGGENEYVKLLVDGVPAGDVESGLIDWRHIRTADIERIEIVRGPGSSLYGDSAMGGVISVFTRGAAAASGADGEVRLTGGTLGTRDADVNFRDDFGPLHLGIDALSASTDGYRDHSASRDRGGDLSLQHLGTNSRLQLLASLSSKDREEPGPLLSSERAADRRSSNRAFRFDREQTDRRRLALSYDTFGTLPIRAVVHGSDRNTDFPRTLLLAPNFGSTLFRRVDTNSIAGTFEIAHDWKNASIRAGTDLDRASLRGDYASVTGSGARGATVAMANVHRNATAFFTTADWQVLERVRISAGIRHDSIVDGSAHSNSKSAWSPRFGATFRLSPSSDANPIVAFVQLARAFKAPTLDQLFDPRPFPGPGGSTFTVSNPALLPQRARNAEIGVSRNMPAIAWNVSAYRMNVTDEIDFDPTFFTYRNIGSSRHTGVEAMTDLRSTPRIQPMLTYAWTHVASTGNPGQQLKNIPEHVAQLYLRTTLPRSITATLAFRWEHTRFADDDGNFPLPDVHTVNAKLSRSYGRVRVDLDALNLFDAKYSYVASILNDFRGRPNVLEFPAPGRTARVTVAWRY
ncbi:MAG TPA: TonB-dependent receptor [Thermoanaerobaculia bacterium]|jgi:outer membrane cobalamin receptor|nr:TonB-dependent receptor [Thermoanaerobaculia bacterium]